MRDSSWDRTLNTRKAVQVYTRCKSNNQLSRSRMKSEVSMLHTHQQIYFERRPAQGTLLALVPPLCYALPAEDVPAWGGCGEFAGGQAQWTLAGGLMWRVPSTILRGRFMPPGRLLRLAVRGTDGALAVLLQARPSSSQACTLSVWAQVRTVPSLSAGVAETRVPAGNLTEQMPVSGRELHTNKLTKLGPAAHGSHHCSC